MARVYKVIWTASRNSERTAIQKYPGNWLVKADQEHSIVNKQPCWFIWPQGHYREGRWVHTENIDLVGEPFVEKLDS